MHLKESQEEFRRGFDGRKGKRGKDKSHNNIIISTNKQLKKVFSGTDVSPQDRKIANSMGVFGSCCHF